MSVRDATGSEMWEKEQAAIGEYIGRGIRDAKGHPHPFKMLVKRGASNYRCVARGVRGASVSLFIGK